MRFRTNPQALLRKVRQSGRVHQQKREVLTQAAIARVAGLSRQTVAAYKHVLTEVLKPAVVAVLGVVAPKPDVKFGVHQVSAPVFPCINAVVTGLDLEPVDSS